MPRRPLPFRVAVGHLRGVDAAEIEGWGERISCGLARFPCYRRVLDSGYPEPLGERHYMDEKDYKHDIAFSFVAEDEPIAEALNSKVSERFTTFLYSKRQEELAGADGVTAFSEVFGEESRLVVVLYRESWGTTIWTRLEETAIKGRFLKHGHDFLLLIQLEENRSVPAWFPVQRIWLDYSRWGLDGAASVIEARAREVGGTPHEESAVEKAKRIKRESQLAEERKGFLNSPAGVMAAREELDRLFGILEAKAAEIASEADYWIKTERTKDGRGIDALVAGTSLGIRWIPRWNNTLNDSELSICYWRGPPPRSGQIFFDGSDQITEIIYEFDRDSAGLLLWRIQHGKKVATSEQLVEEHLKKLMGYSVANRAQ